MSAAERRPSIVRKMKTGDPLDSARYQVPGKILLRIIIELSLEARTVPKMQTQNDLGARK